MWRYDAVLPEAAPVTLGEGFTPMLRSREYPLYDEVYFYLDRAPSEPLDPKIKEYLRFILSREGQDAVQRDGKYLPLTAQVVREQLKKLD